MTSDECKVTPGALLTKILAPNDGLNSPEETLAGMHALSMQPTAPNSSSRSPGEKTLHQNNVTRVVTQSAVSVTDAHLKHL